MNVLQCSYIGFGAGLSASVRNLRTYARTQEQQLAHAQLEIDRIARSREAHRRSAEERILRETFIEAMQMQKRQLLDLNRDLANERGRERDRHEIYLQVNFNTADLYIAEAPKPIIFSKNKIYPHCRHGFFNIICTTQGMQHFYRTQLDMLHEALERESRDGELRSKAHAALLRNMRNELRTKLDEEMTALREIASTDFDSIFDVRI